MKIFKIMKLTQNNQMKRSYGYLICKFFKFSGFSVLGGDVTVSESSDHLASVVHCLHRLWLGTPGSLSGFGLDTSLNAIRPDWKILQIGKIVPLDR
jgi:hypothetical protein